jgi:hypothetical protein
MVHGVLCRIRRLPDGYADNWRWWPPVEHPSGRIATTDLY